MKIKINREKVKETKKFMAEYKKEIILTMSVLLYAIGCNFFYFIGRIGSETEFTAKVIGFLVCCVPLVLLVLGVFGYLAATLIIGIFSFFEFKKEVT